MAEFKPSCEPVAWIDAADFEVLESDRWCVVHTDCCDPGADHNASEPLYTAAQLAAEVAKAVEAERERCAVLIEAMPSYQWVDGSDQWWRPCLAKSHTTDADRARAIRATLSGAAGEGDSDAAGGAG